MEFKRPFKNPYGKLPDSIDIYTSFGPRAPKVIPSKTPGRQRLQQSNSRNHITTNAKSSVSVKNKVLKAGLDFEENDYGQSNLLESHRQDTKMS